MNAKTLRNMVIAAVVLMVIALISTQEKNTEPGKEEDRKLWSDVAMNTVASVTIQSSGASVTLHKPEGTWVVKEKYDYPAKFDQLRDFLGSLYDLKIGETLSISADQKKEMKLLAPGSGSGAGARVTLTSEEGQELLSFIAGNRFTPAGSSNNPMQMSGSSGRYIAVGDSVYLVYDALTAVDNDVDSWYDTELVSGSAGDIASVTVTGPDRKEIKLTREGDETDYTLAGIPENHEPAVSKVNSLTGALGYLRFDDLADPALTDSDTGMDQPVVYTAKRKDGQTVTLSVGKEADEGRHYARIAFAYQPTPAEADAGIDPAETDPLIASTAALQAQHSKWTYLLSDFKSDTFLTPFEDLSQEITKPEEDAATPAEETPSVILGTE